MSDATQDRVAEIAEAVLSLMPEHKADLTLTHNPHKSLYQQVGEYIENIDLGDDFVSPQEQNAAVMKDDLWELHWYPDTPIGFCRLAASSLEALLDHLARNR